MISKQNYREWFFTRIPGAIAILFAIISIFDNFKSVNFNILEIKPDELLIPFLLITVGAIAEYMPSIADSIKVLYEKAGPLNISIYKVREEVQKYGTNGVNGTQYAEKIAPAEEELLLIGIDLDTSVNRFLDAIIDKTLQAKKCEVWFLFMNPRDENGKVSPLVDRTAKTIWSHPQSSLSIDRRGQDLCTQIEANMRLLRDKMESLTPDIKSRWHIKVYDYTSIFTLLSVDGGKRHGKLLYGIVPFQASRNNWPLIEFRREHDASGIAEYIYTSTKSLVAAATDPNWTIIDGRN